MSLNLENIRLSERHKTDYIVVHCAATPPQQDIGAKEIDREHRINGWLCIGYHKVIRRNGVVEDGRPLDKIGAHVNPPPGINSASIGICMVGGVDEHLKPQCNFTPEQWQTLDTLVREMQHLYPKAKVIGHNELAALAGAPRACPSFNVQAWLKQRPKGMNS